MSSASRQLADRYRLCLDENWTAWFDQDCRQLQPAGAMRSKLTAADLSQAAPSQIWPGFMLPDTLPIIGNDYGDWICARVTEEDQFGELIYWYHGGGDWIPVGHTLAEALVHDTIDQFRMVRSQMLRGAPETVPSGQEEALERFTHPSFLKWIERQQPTVPAGNQTTSNFLPQLLSLISQKNVQAALQYLFSSRWSIAAVACDLIEFALQTPVALLAKPELAAELNIRWFPEYASLLFDAAAAPAELREKVLSSIDDLVSWPKQDWEFANRLAEQIMESRQDLGWAYTVAGWFRQRQGDMPAAAEIYWAGIQASSFADQSVRLSSHGLVGESGKFTVERLLRAPDTWSQEHRDDPYFALFRQPRSRSVLQDVHDYWWNLGSARHRQSDFATAYACLYRSGWDLGVSRLSDYRRILKALAETAKSAGWHARARVAETHLACLERPS